MARPRTRGTAGGVRSVALDPEEDVRLVEYAELAHGGNVSAAMREALSRGLDVLTRGSLQGLDRDVAFRREAVRAAKQELIAGLARLQTLEPDGEVTQYETRLKRRR